MKSEGNKANITASVQCLVVTGLSSNCIYSWDDCVYSSDVKGYNHRMLCKKILVERAYTVCPRWLGPIYMVTYYMKWAKTSRTDSRKCIEGFLGSYCVFKRSCSCLCICFCLGLCSRVCLCSYLCLCSYICLWSCLCVCHFYLICRGV